MRVALWRTRSHIKAEGDPHWPSENEPMLLGVLVLVLAGGEREGRSCGSPGGMFSLPPPVLLQLVHSLKTRHHPSPPLLLPSCLLAPQLEVHLLCLISPPRHGLCLSSVHNICSRSLYAPLGKKAIKSRWGSLKKATKASAPSAPTATGTECWNPIIHLISICSLPPSAQFLHLPTPV